MGAWRELELLKLKVWTPQITGLYSKSATTSLSNICYNCIVIADNDTDTEISMFNSSEAYKADGEHMKHCVFRASYYTKPGSIILSAHDREGNRIETIELSLTENRVIQSRRVCNSNTEFHDRIVNLVNSNAYRFLEVKATA